jgi:hypothetical protein
MAQTKLTIVAVKVAYLLPAFMADGPLAGTFNGDDDLMPVSFVVENADFGQI